MKRALSLIIFSLLFSLVGCSGQNAPSTVTLPTNILQKSDPSQDDALNVLMIGNSFCYYFTDELYGLLTAAGYENVNICNVYYSGCSMQRHWTWWTVGTDGYEFFVTNSTGRAKTADVNLEYCLQQKNWDIITLQESSSNVADSSQLENYLQRTKIIYQDLVGYIKEQFPLSRYLWHHTWANQLGTDYNGNTYTTIEEQRAITKAGKEYALAICEKYDMEMLNSGEAWQIVRDGGYDNLCARIGYNNGAGDNHHDGDIGGGQYLNACVWFETITGKSCVGNTYRPNYSLDEELMDTLQQAAHQAVAQRNSNS